ncbi:MAG: CGNR zinc finger domain-containing protein [Candidatus Dormiibacterota bacterium]
MNFDSHAERVAMIAVALVNSLTPGEEHGRPLAPANDAWRVRAEAALGMAVAQDDVARLALAARRLRPVFEAVELHDMDGAAEIVNRLIGLYRPSPLLARHDGDPWHLHFHGPSGGAEDWAAGAVVALAYVLGSPGRDRLGVCSAAGCDRVFIDRSRNGARRFCSAACQSRTKAAAFRARHR